MVFSIGNDELEMLPKIGKVVKCKACGCFCSVKTEGESQELQFTSCKRCNKSFLVGVDGKYLWGEKSE